VYYRDGATTNGGLERKVVLFIETHTWQSVGINGKKIKEGVFPRRKKGNLDEVRRNQFRECVLETAAFGTGGSGRTNWNKMSKSRRRKYIWGSSRGEKAVFFCKSKKGGSPLRAIFG